jgi:FkbM family methyltransferase
MTLYQSLIRKFTSTQPEAYKISFSQCGEDLIVDFILTSCLRVPEVSYLDLGAYHPTEMSNTYLFYRRGSRGVCVEPDPAHSDAIRRGRPRDSCLNAGIGVAQAAEAEFYRMTSPTLNTFSKEDAARYESYGNQKIEEIVKIPLVTINAIMEEHFTTCPNFVSLDVEGLDFEILRSLDFSRFRPQVFCIETLTYTEDKSEKKIPEITELMRSRGYFAYADTYINTIYVEEKSWSER